MSGDIVMSDPDGIVVLCTANVCRSPMGAALLAWRLSGRYVAVRVRSAGMLRGGDPPLPEVVSVMARYGIDVAGHRSRVACAPAGGPLRAYADVAGLLDRSLARLAELGWVHVDTHL